MHEERSSGSDDDEEYTDADRNRISELFPRSGTSLAVHTRLPAEVIPCTCRDLTALFVPSPQPAARHVRHDQPLVVAGAESRCDVSLERMQVFHKLAQYLAFCSCSMPHASR